MACKNYIHEHNDFSGYGAFIPSIDSCYRDEYKIINHTPKEDENHKAAFTNKLWDDGAPHTKLFDRCDSPMNITLKASVTYKLIRHSGWSSKTTYYLFSGGFWYRWDDFNEEEDEDED